jgi:hypothetical protein
MGQATTAQLDKFVELGRRRPRMNVRSVFCQSFRHDVALPTARK